MHIILKSTDKFSGSTCADKVASLQVALKNFVNDEHSLYKVRPPFSFAKVDKFLTGKYTAILSFLLIMSLIFYLTFGPLGTFLSNIMEFVILHITRFARIAAVTFFKIFFIRNPPFTHVFVFDDLIILPVVFYCNRIQPIFHLKLYCCIAFCPLFFVNFVSI